MEKLELRKHMKEKRESVSLSEKKIRDAKILSNILDFPLFNTCKGILLYNSFGFEIDTVGIYERAKKLKIPTYMPRTFSKEKNMRFLYVDELSDLEMRGLGIYEPKKNAIELLNFDGTFCIVPALCVDKKGYRLGYGGGYYDKFLQNYQGSTAVLAYDEFVFDTLPKEIFDIPTDYIITESGIFRAKE